MRSSWRGRLVLALFVGLHSMLAGQIARGQDFAHSSPVTLVVNAGRILDVRTGRYLDHQTILIEGDRIKEIGPEAEIRAHIPSGSRMIDLSHSTILPGLIDCHTHVTFNVGQTSYRGLSVSIPREALIGAHNARITLEAGFTAIRNVHASGFADVALRDAINAGDVPGPRMLGPGLALSITGGHGDQNVLAPQYHVSGEGVAR